MQGAIASTPLLMASCTTGVARSTSQVVKMTFAPWPSRLSAHAFALAGLLFCVSQVMILSCTPPRALTCLTRTCAAARAGSSKGDIWPLLSYAQPITTDLPAADAEPVTVAARTSAVSMTRSAASAPFLFTFTWTSCAVANTSGGWESRVGLLFGLDQAAESSVQRSGHAVALGFPYERARDQVDLGAPASLDVLEHRWIVRAAAPGREDVHLPRVVVQLDARRQRDVLALLDQVEDELTEIGRCLARCEVPVVRQVRERGDRVDGGIEDQLRPLCREQVRQ